jgi:hypothetical protein
MEDESCKDMHSSCPLWSSQLECFLNPGYMSRACPKSCWLCVDKTELQAQAGIEEEHIQRRIRWSQTDFGLWQAIPDNANKEKVRQAILKMGQYTMNLNNTGPGTLCNNLHHECAQWIVEKGSCEADLDFMLTHCSLACQYCDIVEEYHLCQRTKKSASVPFGDLAKIKMHLFHEQETEDLLGSSPEKLQSDEWIFSLKYSDLWKNPAQTEEELMRVVKSENCPLEWAEASADNYTDASSDSPPSRSGKRASCDHLCQEAEPTIGALAASITELLKVKPEYLEPLEFVKYQQGERFSAHHDFRIHDGWRHSGNRVLTVFISLQKPERGGAIGFPEYDWMLVEEPQIIVWPNVKVKSQTEGIRRMRSEQLPVVDGEMIGVYATLRQYPYDSGNMCS